MSQKFENLLNLALDATDTERSILPELDTGYDREENVWELIIKYSGSLDQVRQISRSVTELLGGYAVILIREEQIGELALLPQVDYIEKPKSLYFQVETGKQASCTEGILLGGEEELTGRGVLTGIVDSGIDIENAAFRQEDGSTRLVFLWDQTIPGRPPAGYEEGTEYTAEEINQILTGAGTNLGSGRMPGFDPNGHGTAVAGIAAGNGAGSEGRRYRGVAPESGLLIVKMGNARESGFPRTTQLMEGVDYIIRKAAELGMPVAVNISFGYPAVAALTLWAGMYQKNLSNINLQFLHSIPLYL